MGRHSPPALTNRRLASIGTRKPYCEYLVTFGQHSETHGGIAENVDQVHSECSGADRSELQDLLDTVGKGAGARPGINLPPLRYRDFHPQPIGSIESKPAAAVFSIGTEPFAGR